MKHLFSRCMLLTVALLLLSGLAFGQASQTYGRIEGTVKDQTGGVIPGVTVSITGVTGTKDVVTGDKGEFAFPFLTPGVFHVKAELQGFKTYEQKEVRVALGQTTSVFIALQTGEISDVVNVKDEAPLVDLTSTTVGANLSDTLYTSVPKQRNFTALLTMAPGVVDGGGTGAANPSIGGGTGLENAIVVDGVNTTNSAFGATGTYSRSYGSLGTGVTFDFVKEVQVKSGGYEAEYGMSTGGVVNVITKSGGNEYHGGAYFYYAPAGFQAWRNQINIYREAKATMLLATKNMDLSLDFNGYLLKDKLFFYFGFNPQLTQPILMAGPVINYTSGPYTGSPWLGQWATGQTDRPGFFNNKQKTYAWSGKLTIVPSANHTFEVSSTADPSVQNTGPIRSMIGDYDYRYSKLTYGSWNFITRYNGVLANNWFLTASLGRAYNRQIESPLYPEAINFADYTIAGRPNRGGLGFISNNEGSNWQFNIKNTVNFEMLGAHTFDVGFYMEKITTTFDEKYTGGDITLPAVPAMNFAGYTLHGIAGRYRLAGGNGYFQQIRGNYSDYVVDTKTKYYSFFAQDAWKISSHLTFKAGIRYDYQKLEGAGEGAIDYAFKGNWAPRFGLIYDVFGDGKTKIYGSYGRFYEKVPADMAFRAFSQEHGLQNLWYPATVDALGVIHIDWAHNANEARGQPILYSGGQTLVNPGTKSMFKKEFVVGFDHQLQPTLSFGARFIWRDVGRILEDLGSTTVDQANGVGTPDDEVIAQDFFIGNPSYTADFWHNAEYYRDADGVLHCIGGPDGLPDGYVDPKSSYTAFEVTLEKRFSQGLMFMVNYRLAKLWGNYEGLFRNDNGQNDPNISSLFDFRSAGGTNDPLYWQFQPGYLNTDRRHVLNFNGAYTFPFKLTVGVGIRMASGTPVSGFLTHPCYLNAGELPDGPRGNYGRTEWQNNVDVHVDYPIALWKNYRLRLGLDMFNMFNRQNINLYDQNIEAAAGVINNDFLTPTQFQRSFNGRFSVRFEF